MKKFDFLYGIHAVTAALEKRGDQVLEVYVAKNRGDEGLERLFAAIEMCGLSVQLAKPETLSEMADSSQHQGVVAKCRAMPIYDERWFDSQPLPSALILVLEGVTDPHNLGAVMRSADACGAAAVVVPRKNSAQLSATVHKVSVGASQVVPFVVVADLPAFIRGLSSKNIQTIGMSADEKATSFYDVQLNVPSAIILGSEGKGLSSRMKSACNLLASLPMAGYVDSLNVSVAAGVCLFEAVRQRRLNR